MKVYGVGFGPDRATVKTSARIYATMDLARGAIERELEADGWVAVGMWCDLQWLHEGILRREYRWYDQRSGVLSENVWYADIVTYTVITEMPK